MIFFTMVFVLVAAASCLFNAVAILVFRRLALLEAPSERGLLDHPAVKGGGYAFLLLVAVAWPLVGALETHHLVVLISALALGGVSWVDDLYTVPPAWRLALQALAVAVCLWLLPGDRFVFAGALGLPLDRLVAGLCWLWFVNLFNFMDGIDGIAGVETVSIACGVVAIEAAMHAAATPEMLLALILAAAALGFLWWNWYPSQILLGDVGAIPLGFLLGWLLIQLAAQGQIAAALILPLYFLADATFTLAKRLFRGEAVWLPHRQHLYQTAVAGGVPQPRVVAGLLATNAVLLAAAYLSLYRAAYGGILAVGAVVVFALWLRRRSR